MSFGGILRPLAAAAGALAIAACAPCPIPQVQPTPALSVGYRASADASPPAPAERRVVEVRIVTLREGAAGEFAPREVRVRRGDLLRFQMADGNAHHNVSFYQFNDPTPGVRLPPDSPYLTRDGQSWQLRIDLEPGTYSFGCIPHHDTQVGTLIVEPE